MNCNKPLIVVSILFSIGLLFLTAGCEGLRFAASEGQKQIALDTYQSALFVDRLGAEPNTSTTARLVGGAKTGMAYIGIPKEPVISDYDKTIAQARLDAHKRPKTEQVFDSVGEGLSLAAELAILFGVGGVGFGGKKAIDWIRLAQQKSTALQEIVRNNEIFKKQASIEAFNIFKQTQTNQSPATRQLVTKIKS